MTQPVDIQPLPIEEILQILRNQAIATPNPTTSTRYLRALDSLQSTLPMEWRRPASPEPTQSVDRMLRIRPRASAPNSKSADSLSPGDPDDCAAGLSPGDSLFTSLTDWLVSLWLTATPFATASLYLDIISSLYGSAAKAGLLPPTKLFHELKTSLKTLGQEGWRQGIDDEIFARALRLTKNASRLIADDATAAHLVIHSLTHSLLPLDQVALLKKSDIVNGKAVFNRLELTNGNSKSAEDNSSSKRERYWLPLRQSQRTPKQLKDHIAKIVNALFKRARLPQATDPYQTVEALWAYAALRAGIPASTLLRHLGHAPLGLPVLKVSGFSAQVSDCVAMERRCPASPEPTESVDSMLRMRPRASTPNIMGADRLSSGASDCEANTARSANTFEENFSQIGKIFLENPPRWYAMSLRPGVRFTQVCRRIQLLSTSPLAEGIQLFYPCEEIARAIGKKIVTRQRPFIHSVVFFRAKLTDIGPLFSKIGDLAWCYRQSARPGAPYAEITDSQFQLFQQTIAHFTPDYEVAAAGELALRAGDRVEILGGLFAGQQATVIETTRPASPSTHSHGKEAPRLPDPTNANSKASDKAMERSRPASPEPTNANSKSADSESSIVYRLNIIGDNGIEWRITADPRLIVPRRQP